MQAKWQTTFWKWQDWGYSVIIVSLKKLLKLGYQYVECRKLFLRSKTTLKYQSININPAYLDYHCTQ